LIQRLDHQAVALHNLLTGAAECVVFYANWEAAETAEQTQHRIVLLEQLAAKLSEVLQQFPEVTNGHKE